MQKSHLAIFFGVIISLYIIYANLLTHDEAKDSKQKNEYKIDEKIWDPVATIEKNEEMGIEHLWNEIFKKTFNTDKTIVFFNNSPNLDYDEHELIAFQLNGEEIYFLSYIEHKRSAKGGTIHSDRNTWKLNYKKHIRAYWADLTTTGRSVFESIDDYSDVPLYTWGIWGTEGGEFKKWQKQQGDINSEIKRIFNIDPIKEFEGKNVHGFSLLISKNEQNYPNFKSNEFVANLDISWIEFKYINHKGLCITE